MDKKQKIILTATSIILAFLVFIFFGKIFKFERNRINKNDSIDEKIIDKLYSYLPSTNDYGLDTVYSGYYSSFNSLSPAVIEQMIINYLIVYDNTKVESFSSNEAHTIIENSTIKPLYKISNDNMMYGLKRVFGDKTFKLTDVSLDYNTKAYYRNNYMYIFKNDSGMVNNYVIYRGKLSYSIDNDKTIRILDYYLKCDKETNICYNDEKQKEVNKKIMYSDNFNIDNYINDLKQYEHVFKLSNNYYYWASSEKK